MKQVAGTPGVAQPARIDPLLGWIPDKSNWAPSLRYLLRRRRVLALCHHFGPNLLEVGCGAGTLLIELSHMGFNCTGLETSSLANDLARQFVAESQEPVQIKDGPESSWRHEFDTVLALDVMEHIQNDAEAMQRWAFWLRKPGCLLLTVPAHPSRWGAGDEWAGHFRRYTSARLKDLVRSSGLEILHFECYGFPLANLTELAGEFYYRRELKIRAQNDAGGREYGNARSGIKRDAVTRFSPFIHSAVGRKLIQIADWAQDFTSDREWGSGFLIMAQKK